MGLPSHDTFGRVFSLVEAEAFTACLLGRLNRGSQGSGRVDVQRVQHQRGLP